MNTRLTRQEHFAAQTRSGKTIVAYCRDQGIDPQRFYQWRHDEAVRQRTRTAPSRSTVSPHTDFIELTRTATDYRPDQAFMIRMSSGAELMVPFGSNVRELRSVLRVLRDTLQC